jgi:hypothetical protein
VKAENFCFWLQGFFELTDSKSLTPEQAEQIKTHLALVFAHDPAMAHAQPSKSLADRVRKHMKDEPVDLHRRAPRRDRVLYC